jgi:hypothetical protein
MRTHLTSPGRGRGVLCCAGLALWLAAAAPVAASPRGEGDSAGADSTAALCSFRAAVVFSPPAQAFGGAGSIASTSGTISCLGVVQGHRVTGPGPLSFTSAYGVAPLGESCAFDTGPGTQTYTIPTTAGPVRFSEPVDFFGAVAGAFFAHTYSGAFQIIPADGSTCVTSPVRDATIIGEGAVI